MDYITIKRFKRNAIGGYVNIPYGSIVVERDGALYHKGVALLRVKSKACHEHFARNDDGCGLERGKLTQAILASLHIRAGETNDEHDERWAPIWEDPICQKYRRKEHADDFKWSTEFYNAPLDDLRHIAALAGVK